MLVVAAIALVLGPVGGAVTGFLAGLAADVLPPADHLIGRYALVFCLAGYLVGLVHDEARDSVLLSLVAVGRRGRGRHPAVRGARRVVERRSRRRAHDPAQLAVLDRLRRPARAVRRAVGHVIDQAGGTAGDPEMKCRR